MPMYGSTMRKMTHITFRKPEISCRLNKSLATVMNSQNHNMNMKIEKTSTIKFANVNPFVKIMDELR